MACYSLYRHYDANDTLLYIGITYRGEKRMREHARKQDWWRDVTYTRYDHNFASLTALEEAEQTAIRTESPLHNKRRFEPRKYPSDRERRTAWLKAHGADTIR